MPARLPAIRDVCKHQKSLGYTLKPYRKTLLVRSFATTFQPLQELEAGIPAEQPPPPTLDPNLVSTRREERQLLRTGVFPIGSRRRRAALKSGRNLPFELLPYQCFQEARKVLHEDRQEKIKQIETERARIERLKAQDDAAVGGAGRKADRLRSMDRHLEKLKILADINDPVVKKRFEDGQGDLDRPIYRFLAEKKWRERRRPILMQRITQMHVIPDVLPALDMTADVDIAFGRHTVQPGAFVASQTSVTAPRLGIQVFTKGERLVTVAVVDADVPDLANDRFSYRCHYLAANIPIAPTQPKVVLGKLSADTQVVLPWLPPYAHKGAPYHRLSVFVLEQKAGQTVDVEVARTRAQRDGFVLRSFADRHRLLPVGCFLFRSQWDEGSDKLMQELGVEDWNVELKHKRVEPLPPKKKDGARYR